MVASRRHKIISRSIAVLRQMVTTCTGLTFCVSAFFHFGNPVLFLKSLIQYEIGLGSFAPIVATVLPPVLLVTGVWLIFGIWPIVCEPVAVFILSCFVIVQCWAYFRGLQISCGCFGIHSESVSIQSISWVTILASLNFANISLFRRRSAG
jgi:hypothetical protein